MGVAEAAPIRVEQEATAGFFRGRVVRYLDLGQVKLARGNEVARIGVYRGDQVAYLDLGPVMLRPGNETAPIWAFANGTGGRANVIDVIPGDDGYSPLWTVEMVTWKAGVTPRVLRSRQEVEAAAAAGEVTIARTSIVVNCPVV